LSPGYSGHLDREPGEQNRAPESQDKGMLTVASATFLPDRASVAQARHLARDVAISFPSHVAEAAELVVSELASNCVLHAGTPYEVLIAIDDETIEVVVSDTCPVSPDTPAPTGRGLLMIGLLTSDWGMQRLDRGTRVWARLAADDVPIS
jgi:hypothetical protein